MSRGTPSSWRRPDTWKYGKAGVQMRCPWCTPERRPAQREADWDPTIADPLTVQDCPLCGGEGWVDTERIDTRRIVGSALLGAVVMFAFIVGAVWLG